MKMQIIIVQAEIEAAIRAHIEQQVSIKEGMEITIDLRSTRGDAGFTANIDIVPNGSLTPKATAPAAAPTPTPAAALMASKTTTAALKQPPVDNAHVAEGAEKFPEPTAGAAAEAGTVTNATAEGPVDAGDAPSQEGEQAQEQPAEEKPAAAGRSLFKNLGRPVNA